MIGAAYARLLAALAVVGGACLLFVEIAVVYEVVMRTWGGGVTSWVNPMTEYALMYSVTLATPWMVRRKSHVMIESLVDRMGRRGKIFIEWFVCLFCICLCGVLAYYFFAMGFETFRWNEEDIRAITIPRWVLFAPFPPMFVLSAFEFSRFLWGRERLLSGHGTKQDGI
ncbi:MAG: TRAP transporter small permease [Rhodospirillaceae bacterium]|nr:TRAP transporter small permease [Rhodospirillaceae bacterium]